MSYLSEWRALASNWRTDLVAGMTVGIVALPLALGFAITTGAPPESGLITAVVAGFIAALFGGSNYQVSGPTGAMTVVLVPIVSEFGFSALFPIGICAGIFIITFSLFRLGKYIDSVPWSVMEGFTLGIALIIALQQIPLVFDVSKSKETHPLTAALETLGRAFDSQLNWTSIFIVLFTLTIKRNWSKLKRFLRINLHIPASMVAVILATLVTNIFALKIAKIGQLPSNLLVLPDLSMSKIPIPSLIYASVIVALLGAIESLLSARVADGMASKEISHNLEKHRPNRELFGQGLATVASVLSGGMPATGAIARTSVNVHAGARSRLAAMIHSLFLLLLVIFFSPLVEVIPTAALAGVLLGTSLRIANPRTIRETWQTTFEVRFVYIATALSVLLIDLIWGVVIGIFIDQLFKRIKRAKGQATQ